MPNIAPLWLDLRRIAYEVASAVAISSELTRDSDLFVPDSRRAWTRLAVAVLIGKITDRYGIVTAIGVGIGILGLGYVVAGMSSSIWQFILVHFAIGLSSSATFGPLMAEASHWFDRYRGLAV